MPRVVVVADGRGFGGAQVYARSLVRHAPSGVECAFATTAEHAPHLRATAAVHVLPTSVRADDAPDLRALLERLQPDLVQLNLVDPTSMLAATEAALDAGPTVATLHMSGEVAPELVARTRSAYERLHHVVAVSAPFAALATELGAPRVTHVLNGVDPLEPVDPPAGRVPVLGALGRLTAQKGFDVLLEAVRRLDADGVALRLLLGGEGRERAALEQQAAGLPVGFAGFQAEPRAFFARVDAFVLPSRVEALPLVLLEALSTGLPAVATDVGDVRLALDGVVDVVPPEDPVALAEALRGLLLDPGRRERGRAGADRVRARLTARRMAEQAWQAFLPGTTPPPPAPARG